MVLLNAKDMTLSPYIMLPYIVCGTNNRNLSTSLRNEGYLETEN